VEKKTELKYTEHDILFDDITDRISINCGRTQSGSDEMDNGGELDTVAKL
jgi:hypothetical protein